MRALIVFLVRKKLKLQKHEPFQFDNQKDKTVWYEFWTEHLMKRYENGLAELSNVSLNYLLSSKCKIIRKRKIEEDLTTWRK